MKQKWLVLTAVLCAAGAANGADETVNADLVSRAATYMEAGPTIRYDTQNPQPRPLTIGRDVRASGPVVDTFRPSLRRWDEMNGWDRLSSIPILGLIAPQKMPMPPARKGRYFAWGQSDRAWADLADHAIPGPQTGLISFSR